MRSQTSLAKSSPRNAQWVLGNNGHELVVVLSALSLQLLLLLLLLRVWLLLLMFQLWVLLHVFLLIF